MKQQGWRPSPGYLLIALVLAISGIGVLFFLWLAAPGEPPAPLPAARVAPAAPVAAPVPVAAPPQPGAGERALAGAPTMAAAPEGDADPTPDLRSHVARGEKPTMGQVIERLHQRGIHTGLGAFNPPGTRPPLVGLAVPEDFPLPAGYVRHHQATDDGQRIEAVLMFAPGFQLYDSANRPIGMPKDRVVPPELAPPGLPIRRIVIPPPVNPM